MKDARAREISFRRCSESNSVMNDIKKFPLLIEDNKDGSFENVIDCEFEN